MVARLFTRFGAALLTGLLLTACASGPRPGPPLVPGADLHAFLAETRQRQTVNLDQLYVPPEDAEPGFFLLGYGRVALDLLDGVSAFAAGDHGLAAGLEDGTIVVLGTTSCPAMDAPVPGGSPSVVAWTPGARYVAALSGDRTLTALFDTRTCGLAAVFDPAPAPFTALAVSRSGRYLAGVDENGQVHVARPPGGYDSVFTLPDAPLAVGFGPNEGVLMSVDRSGTVVLYNVKDGREMERFPVDGGPFVSAAFQGLSLGLTDGRGRLTAVDAAARAVVPYHQKLAQYSLDRGVLTYRTWGRMLAWKKFRGAPSFTVWHSPSRNVFRVRDIDGVLRYFEQESGKSVECAPADDWVEIPCNEKGNFCFSGTCYALTDLVYQRNHDALYARYVPERGHYLWWGKVERPREFNPLHGHLPERDSIRADVSATWAPIRPPAEFP